MILRDLIANANGLPEEALNTEVILCYSDGGVNYTAPADSLVVFPENQYIYEGQMIGETELSIKLQTAQALGKEVQTAYPVYLPKNSLVICAKSQF